MKQYKFFIFHKDIHKETKYFLAEEIEEAFSLAGNYLRKKKFPEEWDWEYIETEAV